MNLLAQVLIIVRQARKISFRTDTFFLKDARAQCPTFHCTCDALLSVTQHIVEVSGLGAMKMRFSRILIILGLTGIWARVRQ